MQRANASAPVCGVDFADVLEEVVLVCVVVESGCAT